VAGDGGVQRVQADLVAVMDVRVRLQQLHGAVVVAPMTMMLMLMTMMR